MRHSFQDRPKGPESTLSPLKRVPRDRRLPIVGRDDRISSDSERERAHTWGVMTEIGLIRRRHRMTRISEQIRRKASARHGIGASVTHMYPARLVYITL